MLLSLRWIAEHRWAVSIALLAVIYVLWFLLIRYVVSPRKLLAWNEALSPNPADSETLEIFNVKIRPKTFAKYVTLIGFLHYHRRVLSAWVDDNIESAFVNLSKQWPIISAEPYVELPVKIDGEPVSALNPKHLHGITSRRRWAVLVKGEGGLGKSTLAYRLARWAMDPNPASRLCREMKMIPAMIDVNLGPDVISDTAALRRELRGRLQRLIEAPDPVSEELFERLLRGRYVLVIVDGLSEMRRGHPSFNPVHPDNADFAFNALVVTSREDERLAQDMTVEPQRIDSDHLLPFINAYLYKSGAPPVEDTDVIEASRRLADLVTIETGVTPLLARLFAVQLIELLNQGAPIRNLPNSVPELMLAYLNVLNRSRSEDASDPDDPTLHHAAKIVAWECLKATMRPGQPGSKSEIIDALARARLDGGNLNRLERLRIVETDVPSKTHVRFRLDALCEYLAAMFVVETYSANLDLWNRFLESVDNVAGGPRGVRGFLLAVWDCCSPRHGANEVPSFAIESLSRRLDFDESSAAALKARRQLERLIFRLKSLEVSSEEYEYVASQFARFGEQGIQALVNALKNSDAELRYRAVNTISRLGPRAESAIDALVTCFSDRDLDIARNASWALVRIGTKAEPALIEALGDNNEMARLFAAVTIGRMRSVPAFAEALSRRDEDISAVAILGFAETSSGGLPYMVPELRQHAAQIVPAAATALQDGELEVRLAAVKILGLMGHWSEPCPPEIQESIPALLHMLASEDVDVRREVVAALRYLRPCTDSAVMPLIRATKDPDSEVRERATSALAGIGLCPDLTVPALKEALNDAATHSPAVWGLCSLAKFGEPVVDLLFEILTHDDAREHRRSAAYALSCMERQVFAKLLDTAIRSEDWQVREATLHALAGMGPPPHLKVFHSELAVPMLIAALNETAVETRVFAIRVLKILGPVPESLPGLVAALRVPDQRLQWNAAEAVSAFQGDGEPAVPALVELLRGGNEDSCRTAINALQNIGPAAQLAVAPLTELLEDPKLGRWAADALAVIAPEAKVSISVLKAALGR